MNLLISRLRRGSRAVLLVGAVALGAVIASCGSVANKDDGGAGGSTASGGVTGSGGGSGGGAAGTSGSGGASGASGTGGAPGDGSVDQAPPVDGGGNGAKWDVDNWDNAEWS